MFFSMFVIPAYAGGEDECAAGEELACVKIDNEERLRRACDDNPRCEGVDTDAIDTAALALPGYVQAIEAHRRLDVHEWRIDSLTCSQLWDERWLQHRDTMPKDAKARDRLVKECLTRFNVALDTGPVVVPPPSIPEPPPVVVPPPPIPEPPPVAPLAPTVKVTKEPAKWYAEAGAVVLWQHRDGGETPGEPFTGEDGATYTSAATATVEDLDSGGVGVNAEIGRKLLGKKEMWALGVTGAYVPYTTGGPGGFWQLGAKGTRFVGNLWQLGAHAVGQQEMVGDDYLRTRFGAGPDLSLIPHSKWEVTLTGTYLMGAREDASDRAFNVGAVAAYRF